MSAVDVHPAQSALPQKLPRAPAASSSPQQQQPPAAPQWINDLMDASLAGEAEFRKEVRTQIKAGRGPELVSTIEAILQRTEKEEARKTITELLQNVKQWVANPDDLEEGGRFFGRHHHHGGYGGYGGYGGLFGNTFSSGYYPYYGGGIMAGGCYPYGGGYPYYGGGYGCYGGGYGGWF